LLRQMSPGKALDAGNGAPLPSLATPDGDIWRATLRAEPVFTRCGVSRLRDAAFLVAYLE